MADNWYIVLELEFDPPVEDEKKIAERIDEKAKLWSVRFSDYKMGSQYRTWHQSIPQIKKDMLGGANIRKKLAADACNIVYKPVDELLKKVGVNGKITAEQGIKISEKQKISVDIVRKRAAKLGIKWDASDASKNYQAIYDKYYKTKPQNAAVFDGMKQMLSSFNVDNLYDFLYQNTTIKNADKLPSDMLRQRAKEKKQNDFYKHDSISGTGSKLCGQCELTFKDESSKAVYDAYLDFCKRKAILDDLKNVTEISGGLSENQADIYIGQLVHLFGSRKLAEDIVTAFCKIEKIFYNPISETNPKPAPKFTTKEQPQPASNQQPKPIPAPPPKPQSTTKSTSQPQMTKMPNLHDDNYLNGQNKTIVAVICFFLGSIGIHNFMMGEKKKGVFKILFSFIGLSYIFSIVDFVKIITGSYVVNTDKFI